MGLGIALITKANLGTSAVSSVAYVLSKIYPSLSFGFFTFIINVLYVFIQVLILRKRLSKIPIRTSTCRANPRSIY